MTPRTWVIIGATSIIAEHFAHCAATEGHHLRLVGRDKEQLELIAEDIRLRFKVPCEAWVMDMTQSPDELLSVLKPEHLELDLLLAHSDILTNETLTAERIRTLIQVNVSATAILIHAYLQIPQSKHHLLFLSSVAACKGRGKNSLYGGSKAAIEIYLQGLRQGASKTQHITIARLGFIDTKQTFGMPGIFYAAPPKDCAQACWEAINKNKKLFYFPKFWYFIMAIITKLPFLKL